MIRVLSFGEVLWDLFDTDRKIGGAPFNFSAHMSKLGANICFVSAVGNDALGEETLREIRAMGISDRAIAVLPDRPTGYCTVSLKDGSPQYDLADNVAYDAIPLPEESVLQTAYDAFYFGTLASRHAESDRTKAGLLTACKAKEVFFDINIRGTNWSQDALLSDLRRATILKFSREEKYAFPFAQKDEKALCKHLFRAFPNLHLIILTRDKEGAWVYDGKTLFTSERPKSAVVSTVGAGDSFSACFLYNYLNGADLQTCLNRAVLLSDYVVTQLGAIPDYPDDLLEQIR